MDNGLATFVSLLLSCISIILAAVTIPVLKEKEGWENIVLIIAGVCGGIFLITVWLLYTVIPYLYKLNGDLDSYLLVFSSVLIILLLPVLTYLIGQNRGYKEAFHLIQKKETENE